MARQHQATIPIAWLVAVGFLGGTRTPANWHAQPLAVHEWGVSTFDWDSGKRLAQELPPFIYTDVNPGTPTDPPAKRIRDGFRDPGVRTKPPM